MMSRRTVVVDFVALAVAATATFIKVIWDLTIILLDMEMDMGLGLEVGVLCLGLGLVGLAIKPTLTATIVDDTMEMGQVTRNQTIWHTSTWDIMILTGT